MRHFDDWRYVPGHQAPTTLFVNQCPDDCGRDHAPCTRQRWLDVTTGRNSAGT